MKLPGRVLDLSSPLDNETVFDPPFMRPRIEYRTNAENAPMLLDNFPGLRREDIRVEGDAELAERFRKLAQLLAPDLEEELAIAIGDVPAHGIARLAGAAVGWCRRAADTAARNVAEYLAHERRDLVSRPEGRQLLEGIDTLRDDIDRLEARMDLLTQRMASARPGQREA